MLSKAIISNKVYEKMQTKNFTEKQQQKSYSKGKN